jgi:hypothetical protein
MTWEPVGRAAVAWGVSWTTRPWPQATSRCPGTWPSALQMMSSTFRAQTSLGRRPTSPSSRRMALSRTPATVVRSGARSSRSYWAGEMVPGGGACCREACRLAASSGRPAWRASWRRALHSSRSDADDNPPPP